MAVSTNDETMPRSMRKCVSVRRLADFLDVSEKAIWHLIERRKISAIRVGQRSVRILPAEAKRFLATLAYVPRRRGHPWPEESLPGQPGAASTLGLSPDRGPSPMEATSGQPGAASTLGLSPDRGPSPMEATSGQPGTTETHDLEGDDQGG